MGARKPSFLQHLLMSGVTSEEIRSAGFDPLEIDSLFVPQIRQNNIDASLFSSLMDGASDSED